MELVELEAFIIIAICSVVYITMVIGNKRTKRTASPASSILGECVIEMAFAEPFLLHEHSCQMLESLYPTPYDRFQRRPLKFASCTQSF